VSSESNITCPFDPAFQPAVVFNRNYAKTVKASGKGVPLVLGLERENGLVSRNETIVNAEPDAETLRYVERIVNFFCGRAVGGGCTSVGQNPPAGLFAKRIRYVALGSLIVI
jgi:hypothetical protein